MNIKNKFNKIIILIPSLGGGGAEKAAINLANMFYKNNYKVSILCIYPRQKIKHNLTNSIEVTYLNKKTIKGSILKIREKLNNIDSSFVISFLTVANLAVSFAKLKLSKKHIYIFTQHEIPSLNLFKNIKTFYYPILMKIFYPHSDSIVCVSKQLELEIKKLLNNKINYKISTIYNFIEKDNNYKKRSKDSKVIKLLSVGRLIKSKNHIKLIQAIYLLKDKLNLKLTIIGNGPQKVNLEKLILHLRLEKIIKLLPYKKNIYKYYAASDIYISTSLYESFGNTIVEAMHYGLFIIASNCQYGPKEILINGKLGKLINPKSPERISEAIIETSKLKKPPNYKIFLDKCSEITLLKKYENLFDSLISKKESNI